MKLSEKQRAINLRQKGYSYNEIQKLVPVSKSSLSLWLKDIILSTMAQNRIFSLLTKAQRKSGEIIRAKTLEKEKNATRKAGETMNLFRANMAVQKVICALLYWCEGAKSHGKVSFTNSDPKMIATFLQLFRSTFSIDESRLRVCVHLHSYHDKKEILNFWSRITKIPLIQFMKPYMKKTTGMYKKEGYPGCICISYSDVATARELLALRSEFLKKMGL